MQTSVPVLTICHANTSSSGKQVLQNTYFGLLLNIGDTGDLGKECYIISQPILHKNYIDLNTHSSRVAQKQYLMRI